MLPRPILTDCVRKSVPIILLLPTAWLVVACGGDRKAAQPAGGAAAAASAPATPSFDPCGLATVDEVKAAVGWTPTKAEPSGQDEYGRCTYTGRKDPMIDPPENVEIGVLPCVTNMPCGAGLPDFRSSDEMAEYRRKGYEAWKGGFEMKPSIVAVQDLGVPAIDHELAGKRSIEMFVGHKRLAYVSTWVASEPTRELAKKVLARVR